MKLRIRGNSLRLRLMQSEVEQLKNEGLVSEKICFGTASNQAISYSIRLSATSNVISATFQNHDILVEVPEKMGLEWIGNNEAGIETHQRIDDNQELFILIEKDFKCLAERVNEDETDAFPHPKENETTC